MIGSFAMAIGRYARLGLATQARRNRSLRTWRTLFAAFVEGDADTAEMLQRQLAAENRDAALQAIATRNAETGKTPDKARRRA
jgi:hypothetical protein